jgi:hypothetical protein
LNPAHIYALEFTALLANANQLIPGECVRVVFEYQPCVKKWLAYGISVGKDFKLLTPAEARRVIAEAVDKGIPFYEASRVRVLQQKQQQSNEHTT